MACSQAGREHMVRLRNNSSMLIPNWLKRGGRARGNSLYNRHTWLTVPTGTHQKTPVFTSAPVIYRRNDVKGIRGDMATCGAVIRESPLRESQEPGGSCLLPAEVCSISTVKNSGGVDALYK
jgi:hypothetical protein